MLSEDQVLAIEADRMEINRLEREALHTQIMAARQQFRHAVEVLAELQTQGGQHSGIYAAWHDRAKNARATAQFCEKKIQVWQP